MHHVSKEIGVHQVVWRSQFFRRETQKDGFSYVLKVGRTYRDFEHAGAVRHRTNVSDEELLAALKWAEEACEQATPEEVLGSACSTI